MFLQINMHFADIIIGLCGFLLIRDCWRKELFEIEIEKANANVHMPGAVLHVCGRLSTLVVG